jgi:hypothetical protein
MPFPNQHAARLISPNRFESGSFRTIKLTQGVNAIIGRLKGQTKTTTQSIRFNKDQFTAAEARAWLTDKDIKWILFEKAKEDVQAFSTNVKLFSNRILSFSQEDILKIIPAKILAKIKENDSHPFFTMYSLCHNGVSTPVVVGEGSKKISWPKKAIQSIKNIVTRGVKLFKRHNKDGSHAGRKVIGRVVHSFEKEMDGELHHVFIAYHKPDVVEEAKKCDICSQEAKWNFFDMAGKWVADSIEKLTGIALSNSDEEAPAFEGAKRLAFVQAFNSSGKDGNKTPGKGVNIQGEDKMAKDKNQSVVDDGTNDGGNQTLDNFVNQNQGQSNGGNQNTGQQQNNQSFQKQQQKRALSFAELKEEVKRMGAFPSQLFDEDDIKRDRNFAGVYNKLEILIEEKGKMETQIDDLKRTAALSTVPERIETIIKESKVPQKIADFIRTRFESQKDKIEDLSDKGIEKFIESEQSLFQSVSKTIDPEFNIEKQDKTNAEPDDFNKAENNELLEEDFEIE